MPATPHHPPTTSGVKPEEQGKGITLGKGIETKKCVYNDFNCITIIDTFSARTYFSFSIIVTNSSWIRQLRFCLYYRQTLSFIYKVSVPFAITKILTVTREPSALWWDQDILSHMRDQQPVQEITFGTLQHQQVPTCSDTTLPFEQRPSGQSPPPDADHAQLPPRSGKRFRAQHPPAGQLCQERAWPPGNVICQCTTSILPAPFLQLCKGCKWHSYPHLVLTQNALC